MICFAPSFVAAAKFGGGELVGLAAWWGGQVAPAPVVGHAHTRYIEIDTPVTVGSLVVHPGDLIHGDEHGVMVVPKEIPLEKLIPFVTEFLASEKTIVDYCQGPDFDIDTLCQVIEEHNRRTSGHMS